MRKVLVVGALCVAITARCFSHEGSGQAERGSTIHTRTDLLLVPVVVTDDSGSPVVGLPKNAFAVEENGKPRTLTLFEETKPTKPRSSPNASAAADRNFLSREELSHITIIAPHSEDRRGCSEGVPRLLRFC